MQQLACPLSVTLFVIFDVLNLPLFTSTCHRRALILLISFASFFFSRSSFRSLSNSLAPFFYPFPVGSEKFKTHSRLLTRVSYKDRVFSRIVSARALEF